MSIIFYIQRTSYLALKIRSRPFPGFFWNDLERSLIRWLIDWSVRFDSFFGQERTLREQLLQCRACGLTANLFQSLERAMSCAKCTTSLDYSWCRHRLRPTDAADDGDDDDAAFQWRHCRLCAVCRPATHLHCLVNDPILEFLKTFRTRFASCWFVFLILFVSMTNMWLIQFRFTGFYWVLLGFIYTRNQFSCRGFSIVFRFWVLLVQFLFIVLILFLLVTNILLFLTNDYFCCNEWLWFLFRVLNF